MTVRYRTKGFVFKKKDNFESDRIFSIFTKDFGRVEVSAKAIRKITSKLRGGIEIFSLAEVEFIQGKNQKTLTDTTLIERFDNLGENLETLKMVNRMGEVLDIFIKGEEKDEAVWDLIAETFGKMNNPNLDVKNYSLIYYYFLWNIFSILGYQPQANKCNACDQKVNPYNIYFSNKEAGIICKKCLNGDSLAKKINSDSLKILRIILKKDWDTISRLRVEHNSEKLFHEISENYYLYMLSDHSFNNNVFR
jgi:DNA repair protein RecO (recombination protein O)